MSTLAVETIKRITSQLSELDKTLAPLLLEKSKLLGDLKAIHLTLLQEGAERYQQANELEKLISTHTTEENLQEDPVLSQSIDVLGMSTRTAKPLKEAQVLSVKDLLQNDDISLLKLPNLGRRQLCEIREVLAQRGLHLKK